MLYIDGRESIHPRWRLLVSGLVSIFRFLNPSRFLILVHKLPRDSSILSVELFVIICFYYAFYRCNVYLSFYFYRFTDF